MLTPSQRRFITLEQIVVPALFNLAFNAALGFVLFRAHVPVPLWREPSLGGDPSVGVDILGMLFFLPWFICVIATPLVKRAARLGKVEPLTIGPSQHWLLRLFPRSLWIRAAVLGASCVLLLGPLSIGLLAWLGMYSWSLPAAVVFKGLYAGALAALVSPPIALYALSLHEDPGPQQA